MTNAIKDVNADGWLCTEPELTAEPERSPMVFTGEEWGIRRITCKNDAVEYGKDRGWCTANPAMRDYERMYTAEHGDLYIIKRHAKKRPEAQLFVGRTHGVELRRKFNEYCTPAQLCETAPEIKPWLESNGVLAKSAPSCHIDGMAHLHQMHQMLDAAILAPMITEIHIKPVDFHILESNSVLRQKIKIIRGEASPSGFEAEFRVESYSNLVSVNNLAEMPDELSRNISDVYIIRDGQKGPSIIMMTRNEWHHFEGITSLDVQQEESPVGFYITPFGEPSGRVRDRVTSFTANSHDPETIEKLKTLMPIRVEVSLNLNTHH